MNQLLLAADPSLDPSGPQPGAVPDAFTEQPSVTAQAIIHPRVIYHQVAEADVGYGGNITEAWISVVSDRPMLDSVPYKWISQEVSPQLIVSPTFGWNLPRPGPETTRLEISYLKDWTASSADVGMVANSSTSYFEPIDPFQNAAMVSLRGPVWWSVRQSVSFAAHALYEFADYGMLFSYEFQFHPSKSWILTLGSDMVGVLAATHHADNFFTRYQGNNLVRGGIQYVF